MKKLLFTGASGFLGSNNLLQLTKKYFVDTLDLSNLSTYNVDLKDKIPEIDIQYDIVLHAAGKAHFVYKTKKDEQEFYNVNYIGTKNLCAGLEKAGPPHSLVFISTVAVYGCETGSEINEDHPLNAADPYGKSKIEAETYLSEWCKNKRVNLTILRPSLLAGRNPPGNLGAMIKGIENGKYLAIAYGKAKKSIAMAEDISRLIPYCEEKSGIFNLSDDHNPSLRELEELISRQLDKTLPNNIPMWSAIGMAKIGDIFKLNVFNSNKLTKLTQTLTFSNEKIKRTFNFNPLDVLSNFNIF